MTTDTLTVEELEQFEADLAECAMSGAVDIAMGINLARKLGNTAKAGLESRWRTDLENAPIDCRSTAVDLWIVPPTEDLGNSPFKNGFAARTQPEGYRVPNCFSYNGRSWIGPSGKYVSGRYYYDREGNECFDPEDTTARAFRVTHWCLPSPPEQGQS